MRRGVRTAALWETAPPLSSLLRALPSVDRPPPVRACVRPQVPALPRGRGATGGKPQGHRRRLGLKPRRGWRRPGRGVRRAQVRPRRGGLQQEHARRQLDPHRRGHPALPGQWHAPASGARAHARTATRPPDVYSVNSNTGPHTEDPSPSFLSSPLSRAAGLGTRVGAAFGRPAVSQQLSH